MGSEKATLHVRHARPYQKGKGSMQTQLLGRHDILPLSYRLMMLMLCLIE